VPDPDRLGQIAIGPLDGRPIGRLDRELERTDRRIFEESLLRALGIPAAEVGDWLDRMRSAVHAIAGWERQWEMSYRRGRGRPAGDQAT
jgi:hypothetical protein